ncbi:SPOR domain-containing protein [Maribellus sp. YY47]|uniref:SPOR domain-containing protein n=1 Tax=Maribellus sp. YY47 TaxID=2929486 RepID=UPI002000DB84|nr:SPOR domain-containing protein [Maribellus sp. YY47]MCK3685959.1 SPOR domain-containing protein [Maribellus sp. YY47]
MNRIAFIVALVLALSACKTVKQPAQSEYTSDNTAPTKVFTVPSAETKTEVAKPVQTVADEKPIAIRKEQVSFTDQLEQSKNEGNTFFVIIGSFGQLDNAKNYRATLLQEGFTPIILHSETGYYRVCVNSYKNETEARSRVAQIRQTFEKYSDVWLLIKE